MSLPSRMISPRFGACRPVITLNSVVLPAPFGPMRPLILPASTSSVALSTAISPPNCTDTSWTSRIAITRLPRSATPGCAVAAPSARPHGRTRNVVADRERAVQQQNVGFVVATFEAELADLCFGLRGFQLRLLAAGILAPREKRREAVADRDDRARRVLDDAERGQTRREQRDLRPEVEVPVLLDQHRHQPEHAGEQRAGHARHTADDEREHDREAGEHRE